MNIMVFGATGGTGRHVVEQALAAGHCVTAVARRPEAIETKHERLKVVQGDVLEVETVKRPVVGQEAVVSVLGVHHLNETNLYSQGVINIIAAMKATGVRRLLCLSANGLDPGPWWQQHLARPILWWAFKHSYSDLVKMEAAVTTSGLDWTILRPPRMTDGPRRGQYQSAINKHLTSGWQIARADVADYIVKHLDDAATYCALVEVAY